MYKYLVGFVVVVLALPLFYESKPTAIISVYEPARNEVAYEESVRPVASPDIAYTDNALRRAYNNHQSGLQIQGVSIVSRLLPDDTKGSRHQKFILRLSHGQTILVAHNIDLAPRIRGLAVGDVVEFYGVYEWNEKGGVVHWTHHDPGGRHVGGWLRHEGKLYQ